MANEEQLSILEQGVEVWNKWRETNPYIEVDLSEIDLSNSDLSRVHLQGANLTEANLNQALLYNANLNNANLVATDLFRSDLREAHLYGADLASADLREAKLHRADLGHAYLWYADLRRANLDGTDLTQTDLRRAHLAESSFFKARLGDTIFGNSDLSQILDLESIVHRGPSNISAEVFSLSKGKISEVFLRGCGLNDADIEYAKLYNPDLSNDQFIDIQNRIFDLRSRQAIQISPLFISYSHRDSFFVDKLEDYFNKKGIRFWRDTHDMKAGRIEKQIDAGIRQNPTVLLILSEHSLSSDWVEHEVRTARGLEKEMDRDVLCPVALDDSWKSSRWPQRLMEQIMEYNILDFSEWAEDSKFDEKFRKLIDGLELFYKS